MFVRRGDGEKPHLDWWVRFFVAGAVLAMIGMGLGLSWLVWIAIGFLLLGFLFRYLGPGKDGEDSQGEDGDAISGRARDAPKEEWRDPEAS